MLLRSETKIASFQTFGLERVLNKSVQLCCPVCKVDLSAYVRTLQQRFLDLSPHADWLISGCPGQCSFSSLGSCRSACCMCSSTDFWAPVSGNSASSYLAGVEPDICNSSKVRRYASQVLVTLFCGLNVWESPKPPHWMEPSTQSLLLGVMGSD